MCTSIVLKSCTLALFLFALCNGQDHQKHEEGYSNSSSPSPVNVSGIIIVAILSIIYILYYCCYKTQTNKRVAVNTRLAAPTATQTIIQQHAARPPPPVQLHIHYVQQHVPPSAPNSPQNIQQAHYLQQDVPPPYDTLSHPQQQMGISTVFKFCTLALLLFALCNGQDHHKHREEGTQLDMVTKMVTEPILQHSYSDNTPNHGVVIGVPIVTILLICCCIYYCCRCRTTTNQGIVVNTRVAAPPPTQTFIIQQQAAQSPPPVQMQQPNHYAQQHVPPPAPYPPQHVQQAPYLPQHVPPPYDTQPYPQQQFAQQAPTAFENPNYAPQPPTNMGYGQEKY